MSENTAAGDAGPAAGRVAEELDEPSASTAPAPGRDTGATSAERAQAEAVRELSEPQRLDGSTGAAR